MTTKIAQAYGIGQALIPVFPIPIVAERAPGTSDIYYPIGQEWFFESAGNATVLYIYFGAGVWNVSQTSASIVGTTNQITVTTSGGTDTLSIPTTFIAPGSIASTTTLTGGTGVIATTGNITATAGNFVSSAAGNGIVLNSGTASGTTTATLNGRSGQITITTPTINAGATFTFTISNTSITASTTQVLYALTGGTTGSAITIQSVTNSANQSVVVVQNASAVTNSTGSLVLTFLVLN